MQKPPSHVYTLFVSDWQFAEMWFVEHFTLQAPQLLTSPSMCVSQPFRRLLLSQSAKPASHDPVHAPKLQVGFPMCWVEQTLWQSPHAVGDELTSVSQPLNRLLLSQSWKPETQVPDSHDAPTQRAAMWFV